MGSFSTAQMSQLTVSKPTQPHIFLQATAYLTYTICYWLTVYEKNKHMFCLILVLLFARSNYIILCRKLKCLSDAD